MIHQALRLIRVFNDMKQFEVAEKMGLSKSHISELENGNRRPSYEVLEKYSDVFGIPISSILFFSENLEDNSTKQTVKNYISKKILKFLEIVESADIDNVRRQ